MPVPEAAVDKDNGSVLGKDDVRRPGKIASVEAVPEAHSVEEGPNRELGARILVADARHYLASLPPRKHVAHVWMILWS